jgi:hypothetical protein
MGFDQPLERFIDTKPSEVDPLIRRRNTKKPPDSNAKRRPISGSSQPESVVDLRHIRMRKWNEGHYLSLESSKSAPMVAIALEAWIYDNAPPEQAGWRSPSERRKAGGA